MAIRDYLEGPLQKRVEDFEAHLVDLIVRGTPGRQVIEVYIDNETGITADLCAEVSRALIEVIDRSGIVTGTYRLDVSSPGIDRPLCYPWQFPKHAGRQVEVRRKTESGETRVRGTLTVCDTAAITVQEQGRSQATAIPLGDVIELRVHAPW